MSHRPWPHAARQALVPLGVGLMAGGAVQDWFALLVACHDNHVGILGVLYALVVG